MKRLILLLRPFLNFSSRSQKRVKTLCTIESDRRRGQDSCKIRRVKSSKKRTWKNFGSCLRKMFLSQTMALKGSTMINLFMFQLNSRESVNNSSPHQLFLSSREMSMGALRSFHSSIMWSERSTYSRLVFRYPSTMQQAMAIFVRRISKTTSSSWCPPSPNSRSSRKPSTLSTLSQL